MFSALRVYICIAFKSVLCSDSFLNFILQRAELGRNRVTFHRYPVSRCPHPGLLGLIAVMLYIIYEYVILITVSFNYACAFTLNCPLPWSTFLFKVYKRINNLRFYTRSLLKLPDLLDALGRNRPLLHVNVPFQRHFVCNSSPRVCITIFQLKLCTLAEQFQYCKAIDSFCPVKHVINT